MNKYLLTASFSALALTSLNTQAESSSEWKYQNNSNQYLYMVTKGPHDPNYVVNTILGWVKPYSTGSIKSDDSWFVHLGIKPEDHVSFGFQDTYNNIFECAKDVQLKHNITITLNENMDCSFKYDSEKTTRLSANNDRRNSDNYQVGWRVAVPGNQFQPLTRYLGYREVIKDEIVDYSNHGTGAVVPEVIVQYAIRSERDQKEETCGSPVTAKGAYYVLIEEGECKLIDYSVLVN